MMIDTLASFSENELSDEELVKLAKEGDSEATSALITRMVPVIKNKVSLYKDGWPGHDDLFQEGMLGLISAVKSFDFSKEASFKTYAGICIGNKIASAMRKVSGKKQIPQSQFVSLQDDDLPLPEPRLNPEEMIIEKETAETIKAAFSKLLSPFEHDVLRHYLDGLSYEEISTLLGSNEKAVDNALQRVRRKLKFLT